MTALRPLSVLLASLGALLSGCVDVDTLIQVRTDGSGTVTRTVMVSERLVAPLRALTEGLGGGDGPRQSLVMPDESALAARAEAMGPGVRVLDVEERRGDEAEGYVARYAFDHVSGLRINQNPGDLTPAAGDVVAGLGGAEHITFDFSPGPPAELTVRFPKGGDGRADPPPPRDGPDVSGEALRARLGHLFKGLRVTMAVQVEGTILETDATHRDGSRITLMAIDFEELLSAPEYLDELAERRPRSLEEAKELLRDFPGIKLELAPVIRIRFMDYGLRAI